MAEKTLYLVRHALPDFPDGKKMCLGQKIDLPLGAKGREQARLLGESFSSLPVEIVFSSPLLRARETAQPIAGSERPLRILDNLTELDGGEWDGLTFEAIRARTAGGSVRFSIPPGRETDEHGLARALAALENACACTQRCAVMVAHGGINQVLLCALSGRPFSEKKQIPQDYACISVLTMRSGRWEVKDVNLPAGTDLSSHFY